MKLTSLLFLLFAAVAQGAITERYVTVTGSDTYANSTNIATPMSLTTAFANAAAGDRINVKAGTYTRTGTDTLTNSGGVAGTSGSPIIYRGYSSTIGDGDLGRTNGNGALITTNMPLISYNSTFHIVANGNTIFDSIQFSSTYNVSAHGVVDTGLEGVVRSCVVTNLSTGANATGIYIAGGARTLLLNSDVNVAAGAGSQCGIFATATNGRIVGCRIIGGASNTAAGIFANASANPVVVGCTIAGFTTGISGTTVTTIGWTIIGNTIVGNGTGIGILTGTTNTNHIINNMITDNTTAGIAMASANNYAYLSNNRFRGNGTDITTGGDSITATNYNVVSSATADYVNSGSGDYRLTPVSPGKAAGFPLYMDIGALQRQELGAVQIPSIGGF